MSELMTPEVKLKTEATSTLDYANAMIVTDAGSYEDAGGARREIKAMLKKISDYWEPKKSAAFALHKSLVAAEKDMTKPLDDADKVISDRMMSYWKEQERVRREAEAERNRLEAEQRRLEAEASMKAAEAARLVEEAGRKDELDDEDVEILRMAQNEATLAEAVADNAPVYVDIPRAPKALGVSVRKLWRAQIIDSSMVPVEIAGIVIRPIDMAALNKLAVASQGKFNCPGVAFYQEESTQVRL